MSTTVLSLDAIQIGDRHRCELGDIEALAASIAEIGLLHPIVITTDSRLVAGRRRLEACRLLGWITVPVHMAEDLRSARDLLRAERDENVCRLDMTTYEKIVLGRALEQVEAPEARRRQQTAGRENGRGIAYGKKPEAIDRSGTTREIVGAAVGLSGSSYARGRKVLELAEQGKPEAIEAVEDLKQAGPVSRAWEKATGTPHHSPDRPRSPRPRQPGRDKLKAILQPVHRYLKTWDETCLSGLTPGEARKLLATVQEIDAVLLEVERALEGRATVSRALR